MYFSSWVKSLLLNQKQDILYLHDISDTQSSYYNLNNSLQNEV